MNGFDLARTVEQRSMDILRPFIRKKSYNGQFVVTSKGPLARELQKTVGDALYNSDRDTVHSIEVKAEQKKRENLFLETWSNRSRFTTGWMFTLQSDLLLYHFLDTDEVYPIPFQRLRRWAFHKQRIYSFPEKEQKQYEQENDTWGRCVPISVLTKELNLDEPFHPVAENRKEAAHEQTS